MVLANRERDNLMQISIHVDFDAIRAKGIGLFKREINVHSAFLVKFSLVYEGIARGSTADIGGVP